MEKYVIFDWGGVILKEYPENNSDRHAIYNTFKKFNPDLIEDEIWNIYLSTLRDSSNMHISKLNNQHAFQAYFERVKEAAKFDCTFDEFVGTYSQNMIDCDTYKDVVEYIYSLNGRVKLALFSDLLFVHEPAIRSHVNFDTFDKVFLSFVEGIHKSEVEAFEYVENVLGVTGEQILFIDNLERNVNNAKSRNWNTCQAFGYELDKIKDAVEDFLNRE